MGINNNNNSSELNTTYHEICGKWAP